MSDIQITETLKDLVLRRHDRISPADIEHLHDYVRKLESKNERNEEIFEQIKINYGSCETGGTCKNFDDPNCKCAYCLAEEALS